MSEGPEVNSDTVEIKVRGIGAFLVPAGLNLREALRREGVYLDGVCADQGTCGRCIVSVQKGCIQPPGEMEAGILRRNGAAPGERLACRITVVSDIEVVVSGERILEIEKSGRWKSVWDSPLWKSNSFPLTEKGHGIALDLGTTSIAAALYDMGSGRPLDITSAGNPQLPWGGEIISRLAAAQDPKTADTLMDLVWRKISDMTRALCRRSGISPGRISKMVVVGNSAVHHLSLGLPVGPLLIPPYAPFDADGRDENADKPAFHLKLESGARIYFPPLAGGYAGSDALMSLMAAMSQGVERGVVVDVGTNTEIAVWDRDRCMVATAPSGPAFEGGDISSGMQAVEGAIWKIDLREDSILLKVVGDGQAKGICGTGIVDALAVMRKNGILDASGLFIKGSNVNLSDRGFVLDPAGKVVIEPADIAAVQKAKAAISAAFNVLLEEMGMKAARIQRVFLAGAFGSRLDIENAISIGLLPRLEMGSYIPAGNAALVGASMVLLSSKAQEEAENIGRSIEHVSVAENPGFEDLFLDSLYFPHS